MNLNKTKFNKINNNGFKTLLIKYQQLKKIQKIEVCLFISFIILTFCSVFSIYDFFIKCQSISEKTFRLHIKANSDSVQDQNLKLKVRDEILKNTDKIFTNFNNKEKAKEITQNELLNIEKIAQKKVFEEGFNYKVNVKVSNMYFNNRDYENFKMPAGYYDALSIDIGESQGKNWWCVLFPPLCLPPATSENKQDEKELLKENYNEEEIDILKDKEKYEFKFFLVQAVEDILNFFNK